jgi:YD repeat-containing protein
MRLRRIFAFAATPLVIITAACGGNNSPASPGGPTAGTGGGGGPACRTYATAANVKTTTSASNIVFQAVESGTFDPSTNKVTVQTKFANGAPCNTGVTSYNSVADFVDEVRVIPDVFLATGTTSTNTGACGSVSGSLTYTYDGQRRLVSMIPSTGAVTTYTAWDSSGRPTAGTISSGGSITNVYDDAARTQTQTQSASGAVSTLTYDANGIQTSIVVVQGGITSTTTFTNTSFATVCK